MGITDFYFQKLYILYHSQSRDTMPYLQHHELLHRNLLGISTWKQKYMAAIDKNRPEYFLLCRENFIQHIANL